MLLSYSTAEAEEYFQSSLAGLRRNCVYPPLKRWAIIGSPLWD